MDNIEIKTAKESHFSFLKEHDSHISTETLKSKIEREEILVMELSGTCIGWLRYSLFWDEIPFMNMLYFIEEYRRKGYGKVLVKYWETMLLEKGFGMFLTSTLANEEAQFFYRKLGYKDIGGFILPSEPLEIMLMKNMQYRVIKNHTSEYPEPITFDKGASLYVGEKHVGPEGWDDWFFCESPGQKGGWVPAQIIEIVKGREARAREAYTARELNVREGELILGLRVLNGWVWCKRPGDSESGWVPLSCVQDESAQ